jgi:hypothetical protein
MLFGDDELLTKREKSQLIPEFLKPDDFCFELITAPEFIVNLWQQSEECLFDGSHAS